MVCRVGGREGRGRGGDRRRLLDSGCGAGRGGGAPPTGMAPRAAPTPTPTPTQYQLSLYRASMPAPHQAAHRHGAVAYWPPSLAPPQSDYPRMHVTSRPPSPARGLQQLRQPQVAPQSPAAVALSSLVPTAPLAKEDADKPFRSETMLAPPAAAAAVAAAQPEPAVMATLHVDLAPVSSKKRLAHLTRPCHGSFGKQVAITPASNSRAKSREVLFKSHRRTSLGGKLPAYVGKGSLHTSDALTFESEQYLIIDADKRENRSYVSVTEEEFVKVPIEITSLYIPSKTALTRRTIRHRATVSWTLMRRSAASTPSPKVAITPASNSRAKSREVLFKSHRRTSLGGKLPAYVGKGSLHTSDALTFESEQYLIIDADKRENRSYGSFTQELVKVRPIEITFPYLPSGTVVARTTDTVNSVVSNFLESHKVRSNLDCYYVCDSKKLMGDTLICDLSIAKIIVQPRLRGGAVGESSGSVLQDEEPLLQFINRVMSRHGSRWFQTILIPLCLSMQYDHLHQLGEDSISVLTMIFKCMEIIHSQERCYGGRFGFNNMFYSRTFVGIVIRGVEMESITAGGYWADWRKVVELVQTHFIIRFDDEHICCGEWAFPMLVSEFIDLVMGLGGRKDFDSFCHDRLKRSLVYNHPCTWTISSIVGILTGSIINSRALRAPDLNEYNNAMRKELEKQWVHLVGDEVNSPELLFKTWNHGRSIDKGAFQWRGGQKVRVQNWVHVRNQVYRDTEYSRTEFSRHLLTHHTGKVTEDKIIAALYVMMPEQLPNLHEVMLVEYKPTSREREDQAAEEASSSNPLVVNLVGVKEIFHTKDFSPK